MSTVDSTYPVHREADVVLADGAVAHLRPIRADDAEGIVALHSRFSERTRYLRYFSPYPRIPPRDLRRFVGVDHRDREALVLEVGGQLIGVGRYDKLAPDEAEIAFVVEDAYQGRGVGSVLLEHLAAAAAEEGIQRFVAEVLPENGAMQRVLVDAGYQMEREYRDGVMHMSMALSESARAVEVAREREQHAEARSIARLMHPQSVAVVGASDRQGSVGHALLRNLRDGGFTGAIYPVNPGRDSVQGLAAYPTVSAIGESVDLALVAAPAREMRDVVADCATAGVSHLVIVSSGFGDAGEAGLALQREVVRAARRHGMRVVGPNCFGVANTDPAARLNATLAPRLPPRGRVGFFCQSGAFGIALLAAAEQRGLGLSGFVSAGNRADVSGNDLLQYWRTDPATDVVLLYLETFGNPRKFARVARQLARRKPVVAVASRGSGGSAPEVTALFAQHGVIRVDTVGELFDVGLLLACQPLPGGDRVAVVGNSTALGELAARAALAGGMRVPERYPVDVGPTATPAEFGAALRTALADDDVDALAVAFIPQLGADSEAYAEVLREAAAGGEKPVVATFLAGGSGADPLRRLSAEAGSDRGAAPAYGSVEEAVRALGRVCEYAAWRREPAGVVPHLPDLDPDGVRERIAAALAAAKEPVLADLGAEPGAAREPARGDAPELVLTDGDVAPLLAGYGIDIVPSAAAVGADAAAAAADRFGYPVAIKVSASALRGRLDLGAVRLELRDADEVRWAYRGIAERFGEDVEVLVQPMQPPGVACRVRLAQDPAFGPVIGFGLAGATAELLGDQAWSAAPLSDVDAARLARAPRGAPMLYGYQGGQPAKAPTPSMRHARDSAPSVDSAALEDLLIRVGLLADEQPQVRALELNPVLAAPTGLVVLHASLTLGPPETRPDTGPRRLR